MRRIFVAIVQTLPLETLDKLRKECVDAAARGIRVGLAWMLRALLLYGAANALLAGLHAIGVFGTGLRYMHIPYSTALGAVILFHLLRVALRGIVTTIRGFTLGS